MNNDKTETKKRNKDLYLQVSENFFEKEESIDLFSKYGFKGIGIWLKISNMLIKNEGRMFYNWKYFSQKKCEKNIIEDIIENSGFFIVDNGTFYSPNVRLQLEERGKNSDKQRKKVIKRWHGEAEQDKPIPNQNVNIEVIQDDKEEVKQTISPTKTTAWKPPKDDEWNDLLPDDDKEEFQELNFGIIEEECEVIEEPEVKSMTPIQEAILKAKNMK